MAGARRVFFLNSPPPLLPRPSNCDSVHPSVRPSCCCVYLLMCVCVSGVEGWGWTRQPGRSQPLSGCLPAAVPWFRSYCHLLLLLLLTRGGRGGKPGRVEWKWLLSLSTPPPSSALHSTPCRAALKTVKCHIGLLRQKLRPLK